MATDKVVKQVLAVLAVAYPGFEMAKETPQVYAQLLKDIPDDVLIAAVQQHAANSKWFPKIAELREVAQDIQARAAGVLTSEESWLAVREAVRQFGWYGEPIDPENGGGWRVPTMLDEMTKRAIEGLGGWKMLCQSDNAPADRAHYLKIYGSLLHRHQSDAAMLPQVKDVVDRLAGAMSTPQLEAGE